MGTPGQRAVADECKQQESVSQRFCMFSTPQPNRRKRWYSMLTIGQKKLLALGALFIAILIVGVAVMVVYTCRALQYDIDRVSSDCGVSMLYDAQNREVADLSGSESEYVPWNQFPKHLVDAFVAREDESFFDHGGVVYSSVVRSVLKNLLSMSYEQGASTITMQLTRHVFELGGKTMDRKLLEAMLAQRIERHVDKQTIFAQYLNRIYFGQSCYGIGAAARHYFGKSVCELDLVESATLAGLVRAPSLCNPRRSMSNAMGVKKETLARMLELEFISQEQHDAAVKAPINLAPIEKTPRTNSSYAAMWAGQELDAIRADLGDNTRGLSVVSNLNLDIQRYLEIATERALTAVEKPNAFPESWVKVLGPDAEAQRNYFSRAKRPAGMKVRGNDNDFSGVLQACVLVVDTRRNRKGNVLGVVGGRSVYDGVDRWQHSLIPGRTMAPLLFCCACLPGSEDFHIVARDSEVTGVRLGYEVVRSFYDSLKLDVKFPPRDKERDLYNGLYTMKRLDLARLLYDIQNQGRGYKLNIVQAVWSRGQKALYAYEPEKAEEYICRQSAVAVSRISPFVYSKGQNLYMNETLPQNHGQWSMVCNELGVTVFVWMGFDDSKSAAAASPELRRLISRASLNLARDVHAQSRTILQAEKNKKPKTPQS